MLRILYLVNFWGILPHNYFIKYLQERQLAEVSVLVLPVAPHQEKGEVVVKAFYIDKDGKRTSLEKGLKITLSHFFQLPLHYVLNFLIAVKFWWKKRGEKFDLCIAENAFNGMLGLFLKKMGTVNRTIFVTMDVLPNPRKKEGIYLNFGLLNRLVLVFQHFCCRFAYKNDLVWYINDKIRIQDAKQGLIPKQFIISPGAIDPQRVKRSQQIPKKQNSLAYMGNLGEQLGIDIALKSLSIVKKKLKDFSFVVVGGNPYLVNYYLAMAKDCGILGDVKFYGQVPDFNEAIDIIAGCQLGLALYKPKSTSKYTDVSKVKNYLQALLPIVIVEPGPDVTREIEKYKAGVCVKYKEKEIARTIIDILNSKNHYQQLLSGVTTFAKNLDYNTICAIAFTKIQEKLEINTKNSYVKTY